VGERICQGIGVGGHEIWKKACAFLEAANESCNGSLRTMKGKQLRNCSSRRGVHGIVKRALQSFYVVWGHSLQHNPVRDGIEEKKQDEKRGTI